jgi:hypothetical protein
VASIEWLNRFPDIPHAVLPRIEALIACMTVEEKVGQLGVFADMGRPLRRT